MRVNMLLNAGISGSSGWSMFNAIAQLFFILVVFAVILVMAYYVTKWIGSGKYVKRGGNNNLKLLDSIGFGFQSGIHLVKAGKKYVLLGTTKDRITFLCELSEDDVNETIEADKNAPNFENYLNRILKRD